MNHLARHGLRFAAFLGLPFGFGLGGCVVSPDDEDAFASDEARAEAAALACTTVKPQDGETTTDARARCLERYADGLIADRLDKFVYAKDPDTRVETGYRFVIKGQDGGCFSEAKKERFLGGWWNYSYGLDDEASVRSVIAQARSVIEFLKEYEDHLNGYPNHVFHRVALCPVDVGAEALSLTGSTLYVGMTLDTRYWGRNGFIQQNARAIRTAWDKGTALATPAIPEQIRSFWPMLNPVGTVRTTLRTALRGALGRLSKDLRQLEGASGTDLRRGVLGLVASAVLPPPPEGGTRQSPVTRESMAESLSDTSVDDAKLSAFVKEWRRILNQAETHAAAEEAPILLQNDFVASGPIEYNLEQNGAVNTGNLHNIQALLDVWLPVGRRVAPYAARAVPQGAIKLNIKQGGSGSTGTAVGEVGLGTIAAGGIRVTSDGALVNTFTVDNVNVMVRVYSGGAAESFAAVEAFLRTFGRAPRDPNGPEEKAQGPAAGAPSGGWDTSGSP